MDYREIKMIIRANARLARGLSNLLKADTEQLCKDADLFDIFSLSKSIKDTKKGALALLDTIQELERDLRSAKRDA